jgi:hypothetical protein
MAAHHICPTCELEQPEDREPIAYFASSTGDAIAADDVGNQYEDTSKVLHFLGALAQAAPCAIAQQAEGSQGQVDADYIMWLSWLAEELTKEAARRLLRVQQAGLLWQRRAKELEQKRGK